MNLEVLRILSNKKVQEFLEERMGEWQVGDRFYYKTEFGFVISISGFALEAIVGESHQFAVPSDSPHLLRYPLAIDDADDKRKKRGENPRGLWGMLIKENINCVGFLNELSLSDSPYLVILKALVVQEGIEA